MNIKYKIKKIKVFLKKKKEENLSLDDTQEKAFNITIKMINNKKSNLMYDPERLRRGIEIGDVFVIISSSKIIFTNGVSNNEVAIGEGVYDRIATRFDAKLTRKFNVIENRAVQRTKDNLDAIDHATNK